jgi:hypothetical protein
MSGLGRLQRAMIVAVITVRMMKMPINQVVYMIAMRHRIVPTPRPMHMRFIMPPAAMLGRASIGIRR